MDTAIPSKAVIPQTPQAPLPQASAAEKPAMASATAASAPTHVATTAQVFSSVQAPTPQLPPVQANPALSPQVASLLKPGNEVSLTIVYVLPNPTHVAAKPVSIPELAPNQIMATVTGTGTNGQLILKAGDATLFVKAQASALVGTSVVVSVDKVRSTPLVTLPASDIPVFESLSQALAALEQFSPHVFQYVMMNFLPQPTESLPGALLFLLSAFKHGNLRNWLGEDAVESLKEAGKYEIIDKLTKELGGAGQRAQDTVVGEWRSYPIPLYVNQQLQSLTLYVHGDRDARKDKSAASGVGRIRFLIDMKLSKLGAMQLDGFVQPKKLDMILRSETHLPDGLHHELRTAYLKALDAVGFVGTINFQVGRQHWMVMQKEAVSKQGIVT